MLFQLTAGSQSELTCALMASVEPAGGDFVHIPGLNTTICHLKDGQVAAFCDALRGYVAETKMYHAENEVLRLDIISYIEEHQPAQVMLFQWGLDLSVFDSDCLSIPDVLEARDEAVRAFDKLYGNADELRKKKPRSGHRIT